MVVSEATRARTRRDKAPAADTSASLMVEDASESFRGSPRAVGASPPERETYVTVDALKSLMSYSTASWLVATLLAPLRAKSP